MRDIQTSPKRGGNVSSAKSGGKSKCKGPEVGVCLRNSKCGWRGVGAGEQQEKNPRSWDWVGLCKDFGFYSQ